MHAVSSNTNRASARRTLPKSQRQAALKTTHLAREATLRAWFEMLLVLSLSCGKARVEERVLPFKSALAFCSERGVEMEAGLVVEQMLAAAERAQHTSTLVLPLLPSLILILFRSLPRPRRLRRRARQLSRACAQHLFLAPAAMPHMRTHITAHIRRHVTRPLFLAPEGMACVEALQIV